MRAADGGRNHESPCARLHLLFLALLAVALLHVLPLILPEEGLDALAGGLWGLFFIALLIGSALRRWKYWKLGVPDPARLPTSLFDERTWLTEEDSPMNGTIDDPDDG